MTDRHCIVLELAARRVGSKRIFGFSSEDCVPRVYDPRKQLPSNWDFVCVEGDERWQRIPRDDAE